MYKIIKLIINILNILGGVIQGPHLLIATLGPAEYTKWSIQLYCTTTSTSQNIKPTQADISYLHCSNIPPNFFLSVPDIISTGY